MARGQVKWFDTRKGYGFIIGPTGIDVFVHYTQIDCDGFKDLVDNERVEYELVKSDKGYQARHVVPVRASVA
ncbi:MAG: cold-shock protein [Phycisphaera sp.]|nr:cold-shock protein [Phycisphaera sp.]